MLHLKQPPVCRKFIGDDHFELLFEHNFNLPYDKIINLLHDAIYALVIDASFLHVCFNEWRPTASTLCPLSLPCKKAQAVSLSYAQSKAQMNHLQRIS